jgi:hypothetical protein
VLPKQHLGVCGRTVSAVASDDDASQTPRPKTELEDGMTGNDHQFQDEDLEPSLRQDRDEAEGDEAELAGCRVTRTSTSSRRRRGQPDTGGRASGGGAESDDPRERLNARAMDRGRGVGAVTLAYSMADRRPVACRSRCRPLSAASDDRPLLPDAHRAADRGGSPGDVKHPRAEVRLGTAVTLARSADALTARE